MIKVSVIIPVYNAESTLEKCVDSVLNQNRRNLELILVNDGSKDNSLEICNDYAKRDNRVKVFSQDNRGVSSARNRGIDNASGEWLTFIDSDDFIKPDYFKNIDSFCQDILFCNYMKRANGDTLQGLDVCKKFAYLSFYEILYNYYGNPIIRTPWAKFFKRSLVADLRYPENMKVGEDTYFVFQYLSKCQTYGIMPHSCYMFDVSERPDEIKYSMSVEYAANSLSLIADSFELLVKKFHLRRRLFLAYIGYFKRVSKSCWENHPEKWYDDERMRGIYHYVWEDLSWFQKTRFYLARLVKR